MVWNKDDNAKYKIIHIFWKLSGEGFKCECFNCAMDRVMQNFRSGSKWPK